MRNEEESSLVWLATALVGPLLNDEKTARAFAALILNRLYGEAELAKQQPLCVTDQDKDWIVTGSHQEPDKLPGTGAWYIRVRKLDCRVKEFGHSEPREIPDEVKSIIANLKK